MKRLAEEISFLSGLISMKVENNKRLTSLGSLELGSMHRLRNLNLQEANIWPFGCLLLEMLPLQIPYSGVSGSDVHDSLQIGKRPKLSDELEALCSINEPTMIQSGEVGMLEFLVDLLHMCVEEDPTERSTAQDILEMLLVDMPPSRSRC